jgi:hypothetical protein
MQHSRSIYTICRRILEFKNSGHVISEKRKSWYRWGRMRNSGYVKWRNTIPKVAEAVSTQFQILQDTFCTLLHVLQGPWLSPHTYACSRTITVPQRLHAKQGCGNFSSYTCCRIFTSSSQLHRLQYRNSRYTLTPPPQKKIACKSRTHTRCRTVGFSDTYTFCRTVTYTVELWHFFHSYTCCMIWTLSSQLSSLQDSYIYCRTVEFPPNSHVLQDHSNFLKITTTEVVWQYLHSHGYWGRVDSPKAAFMQGSYSFLKFIYGARMCNFPGILISS